MAEYKYVNTDEDGVGEYSDTPGKKSRVVGGSQSKAGAGRGGQGGPTADELDTDRYRKYREAMNAEYESRAKMLGKTKDQYIKDQAAKEKADREKAPIEDFMTDTMTTRYKKGGKVLSASKRADGIAVKGKTRGRLV